MDDGRRTRGAEVSIRPAGPGGQQGSMLKAQGMW